MISQPGKQAISIHILCNISSCKCNQRIKFGQLIEYNIRNIFLEHSCPKCHGKSIPGLFSKKSKLSASLGGQ